MNKNEIKSVIDEMLQDEDFIYTIQIYESRENEKISKFMLDKKELLDFLEYAKDITGCFDLGDFSTDEIDTIIKLIKKQNKMINLMAEHLTTPVHDKNWVIKYFEDEVELENE